MDRAATPSDISGKKRKTGKPEGFPRKSGRNRKRYIFFISFRKIYRSSGVEWRSSIASVVALEVAFSGDYQATYNICKGGFRRGWREDIGRKGSLLTGSKSKESQLPILRSRMVRVTRRTQSDLCPPKVPGFFWEAADGREKQGDVGLWTVKVQSWAGPLGFG